MRHPSVHLLIATTMCLACADAREPLAPGADAGFAASLSPSPATISAPVFGLATAPDGSLLAAETFAGITELRQGGTSQVAALGGVSGVAAIGRGDMVAVTWGGNPGDPNGQKLYRVSRGAVREIADLDAFEQSVNPDQVWNVLPPESNPFNVAQLKGGKVLVADAAANAILIVDEAGNVDWVAVLTPHLVSTGPLKAFVGCPSPAPFCGLPAMMPAQPVATSIAVGPDGAYYAGELTGFPGTPGASRIWRIAAGSRHVLCPSQACTMVASGLTSVMDLDFGPDGMLYAAEFDAAGWFHVEVAAGSGPLAPVAGGVIQACDVSTGACAPLATGLGLATALTAGLDGRVWAAENSGIPGAATIRPVN